MTTVTQRPPRASASETLAIIQAMLARQAARPVQRPDAENLTDDGNLVVGRYDPAGRWTVKPVRGGVPDAPVERHRPGCAAPTYRCNCPPVDVAAFQAATVGLKMTGTQAPKATMSRAELHPIDGSRIVQASDQKMAHRTELLDPSTTLTPLSTLLDDLGLDPKPDGTQPERPTSVATGPTDPHVACRKQRDAALLARDRAVAKLKKANERIAELEAQLAQMAQPKRKR